MTLKRVDSSPLGVRGACVFAGWLGEMISYIHGHKGQNHDSGGSPRRVPGGLYRVVSILDLTKPLLFMAQLHKYRRGTEGNCIYRPVDIGGLLNRIWSM